MKAAMTPERMSPPAAAATIPGIGSLIDAARCTRYPAATPPTIPAIRTPKYRPTNSGGGSGGQMCIMSHVESAPPVSNRSEISQVIFFLLK
jgi:hypothetical protein